MADTLLDTPMADTLLDTPMADTLLDTPMSDTLAFWLWQIYINNLNHVDELLLLIMLRLHR